ncbi:ferredoxin family protein [Halosimplex halophilum]|uniref:ferredoxin family protein n=1 Tax=Halosimplex halophilum TaxID=2559572 RepID=UPI00107FBFCB|nr:4Fe-4S dicluster domain-containing protein [Halosimplex halophilum]
MSVQPGVPNVDNESLEDRLYTVKYEDPGESHLDVTIPGICAEKCRTDDCAAVCPAGVWRVGEDGVPEIAYENCLECGSCRWACPHGNVEWTYPDTGAGVTYKHG